LISADSLEIKIWDRKSYNLIKHFTLGERLYSNPAVLNDKIYVPLIEKSNIGVWNLKELIDSDNNINIKIAVNSLKSSLLAVKDTIWAVGNKITIIDSKHNIEEIGGVVTSIQLKLELIENNVWIVSDKHIEIWDPETKQLINKIDDLIEGKISNISKIENNVWICGEVGTQGIIWIIKCKNI